jgi:hypothetical protein
MGRRMGMDTYMMFWACLNLAVSLANLVNLRCLRIREKELEGEMDE